MEQWKKLNRLSDGTETAPKWTPTNTEMAQWKGGYRDL